MEKLLAQTSAGSIPVGLGRLGNYVNTFTIFDAVISGVIGAITIVAGLWFVILVLTGGISLMTSQGDKAALEEARKRIMSGIIGLVVVVAGVFIADLIGYFLGLSILNPSQIFQAITPQ